MSKLLLVSWNTPYENVIGGVESLWRYIAQILDKEGHETRYVSYSIAAQSLGFTIPYNSLGFPEVEGSYVIDSYLKKYIDLFGDKDTIIITNAGVSNCWFKQDCKVISIFNDPYMSLWDNLIKYGFNNPVLYNRYHDILMNLQQRCGMNSKVNVALSNYVAGYDMKEMGIKADYVIPNAVDMDKFKPFGMDAKEKLRKDEDIPRKYKHVAFWSGSMHPLKWHLMPDIIKSNQDVFFLLAFKHEVDYVPKLDNVGIMYNEPYDKMPSNYNMSDFFILPSLNENSNLSIFEAMSCGLPIVTTKTGYFYDFQPPTAGYFCGWDVKQFNDGIKEVISNIGRYEPRKVLESRGLDLKSWSERWIEVLGSI